MADENKILDDLRNVNDGLIRKMVGGGAVLLAPVDTPIPDVLTGEDGQLVKIDGFYGMGRISKSGAPKFTVEDSTEDIETWGEMEPSRKDITGSKLTVEVELQDTRKETLALAANRPLSYLDSITPNANGEFGVEDNPQPGIIEYSALILGVDGFGEDAFYFFRHLPRVTNVRGPESWDPANAVTYPLSLTAMKSAKFGYSSKRFYAGPGAKKRLAAMGFGGDAPATGTPDPTTPTTPSTGGTDTTPAATPKTITLPAGVTGGSFILGIDSAVTGDIAFNANAAAVQTALRAIAGGANAAVTGNAGGPYTLNGVTGRVTANGAKLVGPDNKTITVA